MLLGIPDLRIPADTWIDFAEDRALAAWLAANYEQETFESMVTQVWRRRTQVPDDIVRRRIQGIHGAQTKYEAELSDEGWIGQVLEGSLRESCIEIGCGTGGFLAPAARRFQKVAAVDVSLTWLITAKKRVQRQGLSVPLVCACIESLPFPNDTFAFAACFDVLEHVGDPAGAVREIRRILQPRGKVLFTTPNRFSLTAEPHVGVWGVGYLPRRWMAAYVRWRKGMPYHHTRPLSLSDLRRLLRDFSTTISTPEIWSGEVRLFSTIKRNIARLYNATLRVSPIRAMLLPIAPFFQAVATKREARNEANGSRYK